MPGLALPGLAWPGLTWRGLARRCEARPCVARNGLWEPAETYGLSACIECGCCDFVCPSHIPLVEWFRYGKSEQLRLTQESEASDRARRRFEEREARLLRVKQERAEKMARRKKMLKDKSAQQARIRASIDRAKSKSETRPATGEADDA